MHGPALVTGASGFIGGALVDRLLAEGVPRSTQEAIAMGRPVITNDVPGCRDTVSVASNDILQVPIKIEER